MAHVLVVDDDPNLRALIAFTLEDAGFVVRRAEDGLDALAALKEGYTPDVIVLDLMMPRLDGLGTLREMRRLALAPTTRVVILTCKVEERDFVRGFELGAADYLTKPFDPDGLVAKVQSLVVATH